MNDISTFAKIELAELPSTKEQRLSKPAVISSLARTVSRWRSVANSTIVGEGTSIESSMVVQKEVVAAALNDP